MIIRLWFWHENIATNKKENLSITTEKAQDSSGQTAEWGLVNFESNKKQKHVKFKKKHSIYIKYDDHTWFLSTLLFRSNPIYPFNPRIYT